MDESRKRTLETVVSPPKKKAYRGLRHFSILVCKKVEQKQHTSYTEVADDLVHEVLEDTYDEKNIRRRVYDALNVLIAMEIIQKDDKKNITWRGLPTPNSANLEVLEREFIVRQSQVARKRLALQELLTQQVCFRNLVQRNSTNNNTEASHKIPLPFIIVNTNKSSVIQCNMSKDLTDVMFDFSMPFEINDDNTVLKKLFLHKTSRHVVSSMIPADMLKYCEQHDLLQHLYNDDVA